jgi:hypothetical protein
VVEGLYEAEVLVSSQSGQERNKAMSQALAEVFAKVSGRSDVATVKGIAEAIDKPDRFLQQYLYRSASQSNFLVPGGSSDSQVLWVRFDERAVNRALRRSNLAVWGRTRPSTLVWLAVEQDGSRYLLGSDTDDQLRDVLEFQAKRKGLAIVLPLLDLEDQRSLSFADVWGGFQDAILTASRRYQAEAVLVGRVSLSRTDVWQGRWTLYEGNQAPQSWDSQGTYIDKVVVSGLTGTLNNLANRYAMPFSDDEPGVVDLAVVDVKNLGDYARVEGYLNSLEQVRHVQPMEVGSNHVRFHLDIRGTSQGLVQTISLGNVLREEQVIINPQPQSRPAQGQQDPAAAFFGVPATKSQTMLGQNQLGQNQADYTYRLLP